MKNLSILKNSLLLLIITLFTITSCTKNDTALLEKEINDQINNTFVKPVAVIANSIHLNNGMLQFQNQRDYRSTLTALNQMNKQDFRNWESNMNFQSLHTLYSNLIDVEWVHYQNGQTGHSELYQQLLQKEIIKEVTDDQMKYYVINLFNPVFSKIINEEGFVMIENDIHLFTANYLKIWKNGDVNKLDVLRQAKADDVDNQIKVYSFSNNEVTLRETDQWYELCKTNSNEEFMKVRGIFHAEISNDPLPASVMIKYYIQVINLIKSATDEGIIFPDPVVRIKGKSETHYWYAKKEDPSDSVLEIITNAFDKTQEGGNIYFEMPENGGFTLDDGLIFTSSFMLEGNLFQVTKVNANAPLSCEIGYN